MLTPRLDSDREVMTTSTLVTRGVGPAVLPGEHPILCAERRSQMVLAEEMEEFGFRRTNNRALATMGQ